MKSLAEEYEAFWLDATDNSLPNGYTVLNLGYFILCNRQGRLVKRFGGLREAIEYAIDHERRNSVPQKGCLQ